MHTGWNEAGVDLDRLRAHLNQQTIDWKRVIRSAEQVDEKIGSCDNLL